MVCNDLRTARRERGMPISELARRAKTSRQTITNIELYGQIPNGILMLRICKVLNRRPEEIFFAEDANHG